MDFIVHDKPTREIFSKHLETLSVPEPINGCMVTKDQQQIIKESSLQDRLSVEEICELEMENKAKENERNFYREMTEFWKKRCYDRRDIIHKLETERDEAVKQLETLQNSQPLADRLLEEMSRKLDDLWEESKRRRT